MNIIDSYSKLPLGMYLDILDISADDSMSEDDKQMEYISILSGNSVDQLLKMPIKEFTPMAKCTAFLDEEIPQMHKRMPKEFRLGDMTLSVVADVTKMTTAQYIDFQTFSADGKAKLAEMLSCFFIPKGMEYNEGYDILEVQNTLRRELMVTDAVALFAFFLRRCQDLTRASLIYSRLSLKRMPKRMRRTEKWKELMEKVAQLETDLANDGDGWTASALWLKLPKRSGV